jgi:lipopolysaccharide export LptBFGC system permease protein LptF
MLLLLGPMKVLTRYLLRAHIGPLFFAFLALTGVILINTLAKELANLAGKGLETRIFFEFFILSLPANVALTLPMAVLVAVLYAFSQLAAENEITALKASGVDLRRAVLPLVLVAGMIAGGMVWFNDQVLPASNYRWRMLMMDVAHTTPLLLLNEQVVNAIRTSGGSTQYYLQAGRIYQGANRLQDVAIYDISNPDVARTIYADSARVAFDESGTDLVLTLFDGHSREIQMNDPEAFQRIVFERQVMRINDVAQQMERTEQSTYRTDRDMTIAMMRDRIAEFHGSLEELRMTWDEEMPAYAGNSTTVHERGREVPYNEARERSLMFQIRELEVEIQKKYSIAAATLVFVLIGIPVALRFSRGGIGMVIAFSLAIFSIYYVGLIGGEALGDEGIVPPVVAMWLANGLFGTIGFLGLFRAGRESSSGRGGGWADLPRWMRRPTLRRLRAVPET